MTCKICGGYCGQCGGPVVDEPDMALRAIARETYKKVCIGRPGMPHPDSDEGQRKIDRLYDIAMRACKP